MWGWYLSNIFSKSSIISKVWCSAGCSMHRLTPHPSPSLAAYQYLIFTYIAEMNSCQSTWPGCCWGSFILLTISAWSRQTTVTSITWWLSSPSSRVIGPDTHLNIVIETASNNAEHWLWIVKKITRIIILIFFLMLILAGIRRADEGSQSQSNRVSHSAHSSLVHLRQSFLLIKLQRSMENSSSFN